MSSSSPRRWGHNNIVRDESLAWPEPDAQRRRIPSSPSVPAATSVTGAGRSSASQMSVRPSPGSCNASIESSSFRLGVSCLSHLPLENGVPSGRHVLSREQGEGL